MTGVEKVCSVCRVYRQSSIRARDALFDGGVGVLDVVSLAGFGGAGVACSKRGRVVLGLTAQIAKASGLRSALTTGYPGTSDLTVT
jgi:hypothetical protein